MQVGRHAAARSTKVNDMALGLQEHSCHKQHEEWKFSTRMPSPYNSGSLTFEPRGLCDWQKAFKFRNGTSLPTSASTSFQFNLYHIMSTSTYFYSSHHAVISIFAHVKDVHTTGNK